MFSVAPLSCRMGLVDLVEVLANKFIKAGEAARLTELLE